MNQLRAFLSWLINSKLKIFTLLLSTMIFLLIIFPFDDLGDLASSQVAKLTNNQVFLQFDHLKINLLPIGLKMSEVYIDTSSVAGIYAKDLIITPAISGLINQKPYGDIVAKGMLRGDVEISIGTGPRSDNGKERFKINIDAKKISITDLKKMINLPYNINGQSDLNSEVLVDPTMADQPEAKFDLKIQKLEVPQITIDSPMGAITLPEFVFSRVDVKGRLAAGKIYFDVINLGEEMNELHGSVKGNLAMNINSKLYPQFSNYSFDLDLRTKDSFLKKAGWMLAPLDSYKFPIPGGSQFKFKISGLNFYGPPNISALR